MNNLGFLIKRR